MTTEIKKCLVAIDGQNLIGSIPGVWGADYRIDVKELRAYIQEFLLGRGLILDDMRYYIGNIPEEFATVLKYGGYTIRQRSGNKPNVDIKLTVDVLSQADNFDTLLLIAGDGDYIPLIECLFFRGKKIFGLFFNGSSLSDELRNFLGPSGFIALDPLKDRLRFQF